MGGLDLGHVEQSTRETTSGHSSEKVGQGAPMSVIRNSVVIRCKREDAFDYLSDHRAELEWNPKCMMMEKVTEGPAGLGTRYRAQWKGSPLIEMETVAYERPRTWTMHNGGPLEVTFTCRLEPVPEGTRLDVEFVPRPHGWFRLLFPVFLLVSRRDEAANMHHIRDALERRAHSATPE
ncbi:hypothetical protein F8G81_05620 [Arthrobacter sp. CDRTa11]|nr:hypothetical protein F8G81_05620 [Arthrobacter sp. CDRTa11]